MQSTTLPAGTHIFREGDESHEAYRLITGSVEISVGVDSQKVILGQLIAGDIFGEMSMIDERPRSATATAMTDVEVEIMTPEDFNHAILEDPARLKPYLSTFFERLRQSNNRLRHELLQKISPGASKHNLELTRTVPVVSTPQANGTTQEPTTVTLRLLTPEVEPNCPETEVIITKFPFRIGRKEHKTIPNFFSANDFQIDDELPFDVSRSHCSIEREGDHYFVRDRGSRLGTIVNESTIGEMTPSLTADLRDGTNELILGEAFSPYRFAIEIQWH